MDDVDDVDDVLLPENAQNELLVDILLPLPLKGTFTYSVPSEFAERVQAGVRVEVPFGKGKTYAGLVKTLRVRESSTADISTEAMQKSGDVSGEAKKSKLKNIISVLDETPIVNHLQFKFWEWMSDYYMCSEGDVMAAALPGGFKIQNEKIRRNKKKEEPEAIPDKEVILSEKQQDVYEKINECFNSKNVCLLHGVTSSGKTEIYTKLIQDTLAQDKEVLYLLPEIALTTQMITRLKKYFGNQVGIYHSRYTEKEKIDVWKNTGKKYKVLLGARSALFLPFANLGLVIVDEEHETSFKQQDPSPRYHARDSAIYLATAIHKAKVVLGSATPSIETYNNALNGKYGLAELFTRYGDFKLPRVWVANLREQKMQGCFSPFLADKIAHALADGKQIILFQNRRGFSARLECEDCGFSPVCRDCDVTLTYHKKNNALMCHYCGYVAHIPQICPQCGKPSLRMKGFGTERIEEDLAAIFPAARTARMDLDSTRSKNAFQNLITSFQDHKIDILVGTQMVTKGLDFDNVGVVGILNADGLITFPDFRSHERSFHLMTQVSGRAGRKGGNSDVVIQTYKPDYEVIRQVMNNDYAAMYVTQIEERLGFRYPPFYRLINIIIKHTDEDKVNTAAHALAAVLRETFGTRLLGPEYPLISKIKTYYLMSMMLKFDRRENIALHKKHLRELLENFPQKSVRIIVDVDPY
ncbi:MAG: primosomal protein N' [Bacteroidales bacterium]|jgi:primosomal protein N' (replication factor Y)|nr:primosomal protein N' [Bacteroidales bacterium]